MTVLEGIRLFVGYNIELLLWQARLKQIDNQAYEETYYTKKCHYVIDRNEAIFNIKRLRGLMNETSTKK